MALHDTADDLVPVESLVRGLGVIINMLAVLANFGVMVALFRTPKLLAINEISFNMNLTVSDFLLSLVLTLLIGSGSPNRAAFLDNRAMCQLVGIALQALAVASALTLLVIAMSNFWIIVLEKQHLTRRQIHTAIAGIWAVTLGYSCLPLAVPGGGFIKQPSTFHCALDPVSDHPAAVIVRTLNMAVLILTPSLIGLFYALIARKLWLVSRELIKTLRHSELGSVSIAATGEHVSSFGSNVATKSSNKGTYSSSSAATFDADHTDTVDAGNATAQAHGQRTGPATMARGPSTMKSLANHNEQQIRTVALQIAVVKRAVVLVLAFVGAWGGYLVQIIYQVAIHAPASPLTEALVFVQLSSNALLNPILLVLMDGRYREAVGSMIGRRAAHVGPQPPSKGG